MYSSEAKKEEKFRVKKASGVYLKFFLYFMGQDENKNVVLY